METLRIEFENEEQEFDSCQTYLNNTREILMNEFIDRAEEYCTEFNLRVNSVVYTNIDRELKK